MSLFCCRALYCKFVKSPPNPAVLPPRETVSLDFVSKRHLRLARVCLYVSIYFAVSKSLNKFAHAYTHIHSCVCPQAGHLHPSSCSISCLRFSVWVTFQIMWLDVLSRSEIYSHIFAAKLFSFFFSLLERKFVQILGRKFQLLPCHAY